MFDVCRVSARNDEFIHKSMEKNTRKSLSVEESHSTVFQGLSGDKTEVSEAAKKHKNIDLFFLIPGSGCSAGFYRLTQDHNKADTARSVDRWSEICLRWLPTCCCGGGRGCR